MLPSSNVAIWDMIASMGDFLSGNRRRVNIQLTISNSWKAYKTGYDFDTWRELAM